ERVRARSGGDVPARVADPAGLVALVPAGQPRHRLGRDHGRFDADVHPGGDLLPDRAGPDDLRSGLRRGHGMTPEPDAAAAESPLVEYNDSGRSLLDLTEEVHGDGG